MKQTSKLRRRYAAKKWIGFSLFILPALFIYILFLIYPTISGTLVLSFRSWNPIKQVSKFVGLDNFKALFTDANFKDAFFVTLKYVLVVVLVANLIALLLAMAIEALVRAKAFFRSVFFLPYVVSGLIVGYLWRFMFTQVWPDMMGTLGFEQLAAFSWYKDYDTALIALAIPAIWKELGFLILLYIAGLQAIPSDVLEASMIDGCSVLQQKLRVVIPMLLSTVSVNLFLSISNAFKQFELAYVTGGGPGNATLLMSYDIYKTAFVSQQYGSACAKALVLMAIIAIFTFSQLALTSRKEVQY